MNALRTLALFAALSSAAAPAFAQAAAAPARQGPLRITAVNQTALQLAAAGKPRAAAARDAAQPGDVLRYTLTFRNPQRVAVRPVLVDDIPAGATYVAGSARSARADARTEFSADGGRTYSAQPMETVTVNGERVTRPVPVERYTHVRWTFREMLAVGGSLAAEYDVRLSGPAAPTSAAAPSSGR